MYAQYNFIASVQTNTINILLLHFTMYIRTLNYVNVSTVKSSKSILYWFANTAIKFYCQKNSNRMLTCELMYAQF
jgi:hypothetical protein